MQSSFSKWITQKDNINLLINFNDPQDLLKQWSFGPLFEKGQKVKNNEELLITPSDDLINMAIELGYQNFTKSVFGKSKNRHIKIDLGLYIDL